MSKKKPDDYLQDLQDWQNHQYTPGYYTGGRIPPQLKHGRKRMGYLYLFLGIIYGAFFIFSFFIGNSTFSWSKLILIAWPTLMVLMAFRFFQREKKHKQQRKLKHEHKRRRK